MIKVAGIISEHCKIPINRITKCGPGSEITSVEKQSGKGGEK
jgi:hypothetical protein